MSKSPKDKVSEPELRFFLQRLKTTSQDGSLSLQDIQENFVKSGLLETLVKKNVARQEQENQKKQNYLSLIFLLFSLGIGGFGGFKLHELSAQEQMDRLEKELSSYQEQVSQKDNSFSEISGQVSELKDKLEANEIMLQEKDKIIKEKEDRINNLQEQLDKLKNNPIVKEPEDTGNRNNDVEENPPQSPSRGPRANLKTEKTTYTRLEPITVNFSFKDIPYSERYRIELTLSSKRPFRRSNNYQNVDEAGEVTFKPRPPGNYEIRAYVDPGQQWVEIEKLSIKITSEF
ncbi:MAG: coiled-coil domain-containing protein [Xenococcus sp. (in: cyanobacteria)]